jgi:hypothetical protein
MREDIMRMTRVLLAASTVLAVALASAPPASAAGQITWPQVQAAAHAAQRLVAQGGGTVTDDVTAKISYRRVTEYRPGGVVRRDSYREAGMAASEPADVTWTITRTGSEVRYQPMPALPKSGRYPTLRKASWVRLNPAAMSDVTPPLLRLIAFDPVGEISSSPADDTGTIAASWTQGAAGNPAAAVTATFTQLSTGALVLQSFTTKDLVQNGPGFTQTVQADFTNPQLVVPSFRAAVPEDYVDAAMHAARDTALAFYAMRNAANSAREKAGTMTRAELIAFVRGEVTANEDFSHPPADPSTDVIANAPGGLRLTNPNPYSGQTSIWTLSVTPDKQVVLTRRTKPSRVAA